jgi:hypothetical protein
MQRTLRPRRQKIEDRYYRADFPAGFPKYIKTNRHFTVVLVRHYSNLWTRYTQNRPYPCHTGERLVEITASEFNLQEGKTRRQNSTGQTDSQAFIN